MHSLQKPGVICSAFTSPSWKVLVFLVNPCNTKAVIPSIISVALFHNCSVFSREFRMTYCTSAEVSLRFYIAVKDTVLISKLFLIMSDNFSLFWLILWMEPIASELKSVITLKFSFVCCNYKIRVCIFKFRFLQLHYCTFVYNGVHLTHFWPSLNFARCFKSSSSPVCHLKSLKSMNLEVSLQSPFCRSLMEELDRNCTSTDLWESPPGTLIPSEVTLKLTFLVPNI